MYLESAYRSAVQTKKSANKGLKCSEISQSYTRLPDEYMKQLYPRKTAQKSKTYLHNTFFLDTIFQVYLLKFLDSHAAINGDPYWPLTLKSHKIKQKRGGNL